MQKIAKISPNFIIIDEWYNELTCELTFNLMFLLGNLSVFMKRPGLKWLGLFSILSISKSLLSLCFYMICNFEPNERENIPIIIDNDYIYWSVSAISIYLSGYFISLLIVHIPK
jgi:hypothetical protein